ncbi:MAG: type II secretion system F family protein [Planctomycetota bacterium]
MSRAGAIAFYHHLQLSVRSGLPLAGAAESAAASAGAPYNRWAGEIGRRLRNEGEALSSVLRELGESPFACGLVLAGERSGRLSELCARIVAYHEHIRSTQRMLLARLAYPTLLIHAALVFPVIPKVFHGGSAWLLLAGPAALWGAIGGLVLLWRLGGRGGLLSRLAAAPPCNRVVDPLITANACNVLHGAMAAGMLYDESLLLAADACGNRVWGERLRQAASALRRGEVESLARALKHIGWDRRVVDLLENGEAAGRLEETLLHCAEHERERFQWRLGWTARFATGLIFAAAMLVAAIQIIGFWMGYLGQIEEVMP